MRRHIPRALRPSTRLAAMRAQRDETQRQLQRLNEQLAQSRPVVLDKSLSAQGTAAEIARLQSMQGAL